MSTSLLDDWRYYMKDVISPDSFINMGFYYTILASLQRRVWVGSEQMALYPNEYIILVGPPGTGKGLVIKQVSSLLKHHKLPKKTIVQEPPPEQPTTMIEQDTETTNVSNVIQQMSAESQKMLAEFYGGNNISKMQGMQQSNEPEYLFPVAADATTYESLLQAMTHTTRRITYDHTNTDGTTSKRNYVHKSLCFCLEEVSSLFSKSTDKLVQFLLVAFDCGDYDYKTKHQGEDRLRKTCLNFFGGTTPSFIQSSFDDKLIGDGFTARTIFVYENAPRFNRFGPIEFCRDQIDARARILDWIKQLSILYGHIKFSPKDTPEAWSVLRKYFEEVLPYKRPNANPKLEPYYNRKNIHSIKMAMAIHFSRSTTLTITPEDCEDALKLLENIESRMHHAVSFGKNPLAPLMRDIVAWLKELAVPVPAQAIMKEFMFQGRELEIQEALRMLVTANKLEPVVNGDVTMYKLILKPL